MIQIESNLVTSGPYMIATEQSGANLVGLGVPEDCYEK